MITATVWPRVYFWNHLK